MCTGQGRASRGGGELCCAGPAQEVLEKGLNVEAGDDEPGVDAGVDRVGDEALDDAFLLHVHHLRPRVQEPGFWVACRILLQQGVGLLNGLGADVRPPNVIPQRSIKIMLSSRNPKQCIGVSGLHATPHSSSNPTTVSLESRFWKQFKFAD